MRLRALLLLLAFLTAIAQASPALAGCTIGKVAELPVTMRGLVPTVTAKINGVEASFLFDSGASFSFLSPAGAARFGLAIRDVPNMFVTGVGGGRSNARAATPRELIFGGYTYQRPDFLVGDKGFTPDTVGLIGASLVARVDVEYDLANGVIRLFHPDGCKDASLAYWAGDKPFSVIDIDETNLSDARLRGSASVNGVKVRVMFDTGSPISGLELRAAARAGVTPQTPGVTGGGVGAGATLHSYYQDWIGPFASFKIGDEEIRNTQLRFGDMQLDNIDMLVGADFFLSHRIYISRSQHKLYFTYNGGPVFNLGVAPRTVVAASPAPITGSAPDIYSNAPTDAPGFGRRAAALAGRRDFAGAIADLTKAIALDPISSDYVYRRAVARLENRQAILAMADLDQALKLKPDDISALLVRSELRAAAKDVDGAKQDLAAADRLVSKDPARRRGLANAYQRVDMWGESIAQLDQWIAANLKDDSLAQAFNARCMARAMLGQDLDKALADCDSALRLLPGEPTFLDSRGLVHLRRGEFDRGIADFEGVLRLEPNNAWALYGRGWARLKIGRKDQGDADIKAAIALRPHLVDEAKARGLTL